MCGPEDSHPEGYGMLHLTKRMREETGHRLEMALTHRIAFLLEHGRWPTPCALHHCDNRPCVRWAHLFRGDEG